MSYGRRVCTRRARSACWTGCNGPARRGRNVPCAEPGPSGKGTWPSVPRAGRACSAFARLMRGSPHARRLGCGRWAPLQGLAGPAAAATQAGRDDGRASVALVHQGPPRPDDAWTPQPSRPLTSVIHRAQSKYAPLPPDRCAPQGAPGGPRGQWRHVQICRVFAVYDIPGLARDGAKPREHRGESWGRWRRPGRACGG